MSLVSRILGRRLVQTSTAEYHDGWQVMPITFLLFEDRWGRRSYRVAAAAGIVGSGRHTFFEAPILQWLQGGERPPAQLEDRRSAGNRQKAGSWLARPDHPSQPLSPSDRERLSKVLAMLESDHEGEIVNAAKTAVAFLRSRNLTWSDALGIAPES